jgi:hypothetical protein
MKKKKKNKKKKKREPVGSTHMGCAGPAPGRTRHLLLRATGCSIGFAALGSSNGVQMGSRRPHAFPRMRHSPRVPPAHAHY